MTDPEYYDPKIAFQHSLANLFGSYHGIQYGLPDTRGVFQHSLANLFGSYPN